MTSTKHNFIIIFLTAYFMYSDGNVTAPERHGYFYQINNYEQFTEYAKKSDYAILFFNYNCSYKPCQDAAGFLQDNIKLDDYKNVKIFELDFEKLHEISTEYNVGAAPYLISLRNGKEVGRLRPTLASCPKSIESLFKNLLDKQNIS